MTRFSRAKVVKGQREIYMMSQEEEEEEDNIFNEGKNTLPVKTHKLVALIILYTKCNKQND